MSKTPFTLFASDHASERATVYTSESVPRRESKPRLTFRFNKGEIGISKGLLSLANLVESRRIMFANYKGNVYLSRVDKGGFWLNLQNKPVWGVTSADVNDKGFVQASMRQLGYGPDDIIQIPVADFPISASEIGLDALVYPYPFYRVVRDQITTKE